MLSRLGSEIEREKRFKNVFSSQRIRDREEASRMRKTRRRKRGWAGMRHGIYVETLRGLIHSQLLHERVAIAFSL